MQDQLDFVDDFENAVKAEAEEAYVDLYQEYEKVTDDYIALQRQYLVHLEGHTDYIVALHGDMDKMKDQLAKSNASGLFYCFVALVSLGYIFFTV